MRTLVSTILVGATLVAGPALAQQHPWVPSGVNAATGSLSNDDPAVTRHPWVSSTVYEGNLPNGDALARADGRRPRHHTGTQPSSADK
jgi:hypothetical protein